MKIAVVVSHVAKRRGSLLHRNAHEAAFCYTNTTNRHCCYCSVFPPQPHRILQALRRYVRAENKDRQHTIRHYQHVLAVDPEKAAQMKSQVCVFIHLITTDDDHLISPVPSQSHISKEFVWSNNL